MAQQQEDKKIGFKTFILFKDQTLGIGAYGAVCKANCDDLLCAAKIIHPTLFDPTALHQIKSHREHRLPIRRFQLECEFLSTVRHPNIVQYLGTHQDPETRLPVLLMELMDDNLTHFLENSPQPIPYHIQVNICHDITLALSFLHSNGIIHRDLSSNNVLLIGNIRAKLTDFGMARLGSLNLYSTRVTNTTCPGTNVYMPPEAVQDKPVYTEKIDCFSFGVITVQTLTREFPNPGDRMMTVNDPRYPRPLKMSVPEIERRQNHISGVDPNHPLLPIALDCLKDADGERPSAWQLCERVEALKETAKYKNASERVKDNSGKSGEYEQIQSLKQNLKERNRVISEKDATIAEKEQQLRQCREELTQQIQQLEREKRHVKRERDQVIQETVEKDQAIQEKVRQLGRVNQQLEESERLITDFGKRNRELEEQLSVIKSQVQEKDGGAKARELEEQLSVTKNQVQEKDGGAKARAIGFRLRWRDGKKAPCEMERTCDAIVFNNTVYCKYSHDNKIIYTYDIPSSNWSSIPDCPTKHYFTLTVIDGLLTTIGGYGDNLKNTNKLFSLTGESSGRRWTEKFPPMPTKRYSVSALCTGTDLIVVGGIGRGDNDETLKTVEVLNTVTRRWYIAPELPEPLSQSSVTLCCDLVYLLGGVDKDDESTNSVYCCSLSSLPLSTGSKSQGLGHLVSTQMQSNQGNIIWNRVANLPVESSTAVTFHGQLLAIGGWDLHKSSTAVHKYQPTTNSWEVISHLTIPRNACLAAVLPDNQLMVVGGYTTGDKLSLSDSVEFGRV